MICKYGKSVGDIGRAKKTYFDDNDVLVAKQNEYADIYKMQPLRHACKMCGTTWNEGISYESHGLNYVICKKCGHVSGIYEETEEYCKNLYSDSDYGAYTYSEKDQKDYDDRLEKIYKPKASFLFEVLEQEGIDIGNIEILDIGAGSGYFVSACDDFGVFANGVDMSKHQINYGKKCLHNSRRNGEIRHIQNDELVLYLQQTTANVISAIGVLEHLIDFHKILEAIHENRNIKYFYFMVPMFGLSNILETLLPDVFNRHLGGPHTHVFSHESVEYMCNKYEMDMIAKWQFGTDIMDLYRMCMVKNNKTKLTDEIYEKFYPCIDAMQAVLDKNDFCSEIHVVCKKKN